MRGIKYVLLAASAFAFLALAPAPRASAQVSFGINIGNAPVCPYGYYGYAPYRCSPYGYYGQEWFNNGVFIGAGPYFRGPRGFYGHVDRHFDPRYGYRGGFPDHGAYREPADHWQNFHGGTFRDYLGHERSDFHHSDHDGYYDSHPRGDDHGHR